MTKPFTRAEFTSWYGPHPDWMWEMLVWNYENRSWKARNVSQVEEKDRPDSPHCNETGSEDE